LEIEMGKAEIISGATGWSIVLPERELRVGMSEGELREICLSVLHLMQVELKDIENPAIQAFLGERV